MKGKRILALLLSLAMILTSTVMDASAVFGAEKESGEKKGATQQSVAEKEQRHLLTRSVQKKS